MVVTISVLPLLSLPISIFQSAYNFKLSHEIGTPCQGSTFSTPFLSPITAVRGPMTDCGVHFQFPRF